MTIQRPLSSDNLTEIAIDFTRPVYLIHLLFPFSDTYLSTGPQIAHDSNTYIEGQVSMSSVTWDGDGSQSASLLLSNENNSASALLLGATMNDIKVVVWKTYLISGGGNTTPTVYLTGTLDGATIGASSSEVGIVSTTSFTAFVPSRYHTPAEGFNWLPITGELVAWGEEIFLLQEENL